MKKLTDKELEWIRANTISHEEHMMEMLQDPEYQKGWLAETIRDYIETGDYNSFYRGLEYVIKARGTVSEFAKKVGINRSNLVDLLHGKTKTSPNFSTITKILNGLGYTLSVEELSA